MDALTAFGLFDITAMVARYSLESRSRWYVLGLSLDADCGKLLGVTS